MVKELEWNINTEGYCIELQSLVGRENKIMFRHHAFTDFENEIKPPSLLYSQGNDESGRI